MKKVVAILTVLMLAFSLVACSAAQATETTEPEATSAPVTEATTEAPAEQEQFTIGYAAPDLSSEYNMMVHNSLETLSAEQGIKLLTLSAEGDVNLQVQQVENFITMGIDALIIYPVDPTVLGPTMLKAKEAGIYVVNADQIASADSYDVAISADMRDLGVQCVMMASDWVDKTFPDAADGSVKVAVFGFWLSEQFAARCDVMTEIADYNKKCEVVAVYDTTVQSYQTDIANNAAILLQQHPDVNVILSFTDIFALMIDEVVMQNAASLDLSKIGQFTVDRSKAGFSKIKLAQTNESTLRGTIVPGIDIAQDLIDAATQKIDKSLFLENNIYNEPLFAVTEDNVDDYMDWVND
ncbi:MAG: sugar ABC transporter substrate-binding protein [Clostridiales bacterium]|nr:sugar ABC transporter substrate-binding protein [Clostridiales bacterium]